MRLLIPGLSTIEHTGESGVQLSGFAGIPLPTDVVLSTIHVVVLGGGGGGGGISNCILSGDYV